MDRVAALERVLPLGAAAGGRGGPGAGVSQSCGGALLGGAGGGAASTRSAPEGSLLYRVEALEEALQVLLAAQEEALVQQRAAAAAAEQHRAADAQRQQVRACVRVCDPPSTVPAGAHGT
jgi:hypothetical protein